MRSHWRCCSQGSTCHGIVDDVRAVRAAARGPSRSRGTGSDTATGCPSGRPERCRTGVGYQQILDFYYPGTASVTQTNQDIAVLVSADSDNDLRVLASPA
ncbi:hypothetical protein NKG05_20805 [Oerskovia sp. M15]